MFLPHRGDGIINPEGFLPHRRGAEAAPRLALAVMPAMPRLEAELVGLPPTLLAGELACCTLRCVR